MSTDPARQRDLIARLRQEARQAGQPAPPDLAERIATSLPRRPIASPFQILVAAAAAAALVVSLLWLRTAPTPAPQQVAVAPAPTALPAPTIDPQAMPEAFTSPEHPLSGELAALRRDGERLVDFLSAVGEPLRSAGNLGADAEQPTAQ